MNHLKMPLLIAITLVSIAIASTIGFAGGYSLGYIKGALMTMEKSNKAAK